MVEVVQKSKVVKEVEGRTEAPKLGVNQTNQGWESWKSIWARYKRDTGLKQLCLQPLGRGCFTRELKITIRRQKRRV